MDNMIIPFQAKVYLNNKKLYVRNNFLVSFICFFSWFFFPIFYIPLFLYLLGSERLTINRFNQIYLILLVALSFGLISYVTGSGGKMITDMIRYRQVFGLMTDRTVEDLLFNGSSFPFVLLNWIIANFISSNDQMMSFIITSLSYFFLLLGINKICNSFVEKKYRSLIIISVVLIISIITSTEYLKQFLSSSIFLYGLSLKFENKKKSYIKVNENRLNFNMNF